MTLIINLMKLTSTSATNTTIATDALLLISRLKVYAGIADLATTRYKLMARRFLGVSFEHCSNHLQVRCFKIPIYLAF